MHRPGCTSEGLFWNVTSSLVAHFSWLEILILPFQVFYSISLVFPLDTYTYADFCQVFSFSEHFPSLVYHPRGGHQGAHFLTIEQVHLPHKNTSLTSAPPPTSAPPLTSALSLTSALPSLVLHGDCVALGCGIQALNSFTASNTSFLCKN